MKGNYMNQRTKFITRTAMFAAVIALLSPFAVPVGPVPVTLSLFAVLLAAIVLDWKQAAAAIAIYILLGAVGLPVFSGGKGGAAVLVGATGGYIWSYIPCAICASLISGAGSATGARRMLIAGIGCICGTILCYLCGTWQFAAVSGRTFAEAASVCVLPFIIPDLIKCACAAAIGTQIKKRI